MRLLREPLLHFLLAGALLFATDTALRENAAPSGQVIRISEEAIAGLRAQWVRLYNRPPAPAELRGLVDARVREEVLYREALAMGLDRDDSIVRRRLAQKLEFLIEDLAAAREPTDAELSAFFEARRERYEVPARVSFSHIYFSPDRRGPAAAPDAELVLAGLRPDAPAGAAADLGDRFLMGEAHVQQSAEEIEAVFGREFAEALVALAPGAWAGPITSAYGWHLVRIEVRSDARLPALAEVRERVRQDWAYEQLRAANDAVFNRLLARYELVIDDGAPSPLAPATERVDAEGQP